MFRQTRIINNLGNAMPAMRFLRMNNQVPKSWISTESKKLTCYYWGSMDSGSLIPGSSKQLVPQEVAAPGGADSVIDAAFGKHHRALVTSDGEVYTWGKGKYHELGIGQHDLVEEPTLVRGIENVLKVRCGDHHTLALTEDGNVYSWGWGGNFFNAGCLGHSSTADCESPTLIQALADVNIIDIASGKYHCLALSDEGEVYSWGRGEYGRLGTGSSGNQKEPEIMAFFEDQPVKSIACGSSFGTAITDDGLLYAWGKNDYGQLGQQAGLSMDVYNSEPAPVLVETLKDEPIVDISCGDNHCVAATEEGKLYFWGKRAHLLPNLVRGDHGSMGELKITTVAAGKGFSAAVDTEGKLYTWGDGGSGCLGHGNEENEDQPKEVRGFGGAGRKIVKVHANNQQIAVFTEE